MIAINIFALVIFRVVPIPDFWGLKIQLNLKLNPTPIISSYSNHIINAVHITQCFLIYLQKTMGNHCHHYFAFEQDVHT